MATKRKPKKKIARKRRTTKEPVLTKLDFWAIAANEVYMACRKSGMDEGTALAFAMDRSSYPDWIVDTKDPIKNPLDDFDEDDDGTKTNRTKKNEFKGMILYFSSPEGKPVYVYKDLHLVNQAEVDSWEIRTIEESEAANQNWIKTIYWKLETLSCVLIQRNTKWFSDNIQQLQNVWSIIERERVTGYEHRAPKKRSFKDNHAPRKSHESMFGQGCLITLLNHDD